MNGSIIHSQRRFFDGFGQCRMSMAAASDVFAAGSEAHRNRGFRDQFSRVSTNDVNA